LPNLIGSSLWTILDQIRGLQHFFPQVDIKYDTESPVTTPIILHLRPHLDLLFSGYHQRLHLISVRRLRDHHPPITLRYQQAGKDVVLSGPNEILKKLGVSRTFGPTYPGDDLKYPGVWFSFEEDGQPGSSTARFEAGRNNEKNRQADDKMNEVKKVVVCQKAGENEERDALDEVTESEVMDGDISRAIVKARFILFACVYDSVLIAHGQVHDGVTLYFYPSSTNPMHIAIGTTTAQDLTIDLGPPARIHYKEDDRMKIHIKASAEEDPEQDCRLVITTSSFSRRPLCRLLQLLSIRYGYPHIRRYSCCEEDCAPYKHCELQSSSLRVNVLTT
jgi:hypothetical protein